ncbi:exported hypothetical protein [Planktothrix serta PCC 8927]|uniref:Uncharacterized protein n=1 Tax=Planktothrix serta PCC 8927 TaxID=671068 RepID=A0A7Z9E439_9CYAN|nr:exported hypothetical protein [Planktothrix serta PCC 8927]
MSLKFISRLLTLLKVVSPSGLSSLDLAAKPNINNNKFNLLVLSLGDEALKGLLRSRGMKP